MAKSGKSPSYHQKLRDEKRGEEIRKDNRGIVQIIGALSGIIWFSVFFLTEIDYFLEPLFLLILLSILYFRYQAMARVINLPIDFIKKLIIKFQDREVDN
jgi:hypothetical protein